MQYTRLPCNCESFPVNYSSFLQPQNFTSVISWGSFSDVQFAAKAKITSFYCNKPHTHTYGTNQVHTQHCTSSNMMYHPEAFPCEIKSAGSPFQISAEIASQLCIDLSNVLKLEG